MKKMLLVAAVITFVSLPALLPAQDAKDEKTDLEKNEKNKRSETQEIIIRNKGEKEMNLKLEINGDNIIVNGKPLAEFKDDKVTINKRKILVRDGDRLMALDMNGDNMMFEENFLKNWKAEGKETIKPFLGVTTEKADEGAKITNVVKAGAAEKAGLKKDDIITRVGDQKVTDGESLSELIASKKPMETVKVTYLRNGKEGSVKVVLAERKVGGNMAFAFKGPRGDVRSFTVPRTYGAPNAEFYHEDALANLDNFSADGNFNFAPYASFSRQKKLGLKIQDTDEGGNVKVIDVEEGSAAEKAGLKKDDIITEIAGKKVNNTDEAREQLNPAEVKSSYQVKARRNGSDMTFDIKIPKKLKTANL